MFSDDAFNKQIGSSNGQGTLIGNWFEERCLRESAGEGRTVPMRHIPRSGLLQDFTKTPQSGPRAMDNTFERVTGPKAEHCSHAPSSRTIGQHDQETVNHVGPRQQARRQQNLEVADQEVQDEEAALARKDQERCFDTTHGRTYTKPDESMTEPAAHLNKSCHHELLHGPTPDRLLALSNDGLEFSSHTHYSNVEGISAHRIALGDPALRNDLKVTAAGGVRVFGKSSEFSKPVAEFTRGLAKDEELAAMYNDLKRTQPLRTLNGGEPRATTFAGVPSLAALKTRIHEKISAVWGPNGYIALRQRLFEHGDHEGFCQVANITAVLREQLGLTTAEVPKEMLDAYFKQLITMKKTELKISSFMSSLRPPLAPRDRRRVLEAFRAMESGGSLPLGDWLARIQDAEVRGSIVTAFGAEDAETVSGMPITEPVFLEVLSDLAPFMSVEALLA